MNIQNKKTMFKIVFWINKTQYLVIILGLFSRCEKKGGGAHVLKEERLGHPVVSDS